MGVTCSRAVPPNNNLVLGDAFDRVWIANSWYRVLKDNYNANYNKKLVIREQQISKSTFRFIGHYFADSSSSTGYGESDIKPIIDNYYQNYIKAIYNHHILPVDLNLPNYSENTSLPLNGFKGDNYSVGKWYWTDMDEYYSNRHFSTALEDILTNDDNHSNDVNEYQSQAFALSLGDINQYLIDNSGKKIRNSELLNFNDEFWLRTAGDSWSSAAYIESGIFRSYGTTFTGDKGIRPILWIRIN